MVAKKLSITLPEELAEVVKQTAEEEGISVSAVLAEAVTVLVRRRAAVEATTAFEAEEGPLTPDALAEAEAVWSRVESRPREQSLRSAS